MDRGYHRYAARQVRANGALALFRAQDYPWTMIATVTKKRQVVLPAEVCEELGIRPGVRLDFRAKKGKLEAVKLPAGRVNSSKRSLRHLYTARRNAEELVIQKGCSCDVPEDFPK